MTRLLFIGDIVGQAGLQYLEARLPKLIAHCQPDFIVANAENLDLTGPGFGMLPQSLERLLALGVDLVTGGNHSWDGPQFQQVQAHPRVLRPLNYSPAAPGKGSMVLEKGGYRLGVVNLASRTALPWADDPVTAMEGVLARWEGSVNGIVVDFHGESVYEKLGFAFLFDGRVSAVLGTHTHVPTLDTRVLPGGTAYVSDVGMTGPRGGIQGLRPEGVVSWMRSRLPKQESLELASGPVELGAVLVELEGVSSTSIERLPST
jgi:metallophosphoesterase (TIGR00282 family)